MAIKDRFTGIDLTADETDVEDIFAFFASHPWLFYLFGVLAVVAVVWVAVGVFL